MAIPPSHPLESTAVLLDRIRAGDGQARDRLLERYLPLLRAWAHGRLPATARGMADTEDVVQISLYGALNQLERFDHRHEGAFFAYLRQSALNAVRQEIRRSVRRPSVPAEVADAAADASASLVERAIGREMLECYESALMQLTAEQREAVVLRVEFGLSYPEIAEAMGKPSANAARMLVVRALVPLAEAMHEHREPA